VAQDRGQCLALNVVMNACIPQHIDYCVAEQPIDSLGRLSCIELVNIWYCNFQSDRLELMSVGCGVLKQPHQCTSG
jgi:hypothetical protein